MAKVEELANEVQQLSRDELAVFREWFRKYDSDEWDKEIFWENYERLPPNIQKLVRVVMLGI